MAYQWTMKPGDVVNTGAAVGARPNARGVAKSEFGRKADLAFDRLGRKLKRNGSSAVNNAAKSITSAAGKAKDTLKDAADNLLNPPSDRDDLGIVSGLYDDKHYSRGPGASAKGLSYLNADWAAYYGMDASTAYAEAMQNTTYQRTMKDMQAAGLNPALMFANGANTNTSFYMGSPASSGGGGGGGGSSSGSSSYGSSSASQLFSKDAYKIIGEVGGIAAAAISKRPYNYSSGKSLAQGAMRLANSISNVFRRR